MIKEKNKVDLNNEEVKSLLSYIPKWSDHTIDSAEGAGTLTKEVASGKSGIFMVLLHKQQNISKCNRSLVLNSRS